MKTGIFRNNSENFAIVAKWKFSLASEKSSSYPLHVKIANNVPF